MSAPKVPSSSASGVGKVPNVLPNWWAFSFVGLQASALLPLAAQYFFTPLTVFANILPPGYDTATDGLKESLRVEIANQNAAHSFLMIAALFIGCTLFARNSLKGQPKLQQRLIKLPIICGLASDFWLYGIILTKIPKAVLYDTSAWTPSMQGMIYGLPVATLLKGVWLAGVGRDVV